MCFYLKSGLDTEHAKLATRDIAVYKLFRITGRGAILSPFRICRWKVGYIKKASLKIKGYYTMSEGLHSFVGVPNARDFAFRESTHVLLKCIIPAGAYYFKNDTQYVSNELVVLNNRPVSMAGKRRK